MVSDNQTRLDILKRISSTARAMQSSLTPKPKLKSPVQVTPLQLTCPASIEQELSNIQYKNIRHRLRKTLRDTMEKFEKHFTDACCEPAAAGPSGTVLLEQLRRSLTSIFLRNIIPMLQTYIERISQIPPNSCHTNAIPKRLPSTQFQPVISSSHSQGSFNAHSQPQPIASQPGTSFQNPINLTTTPTRAPLFPEHLIPQVDGFNTDYTPFLLRYFSFNAYPSTSDRALIASKAKISSRQVEVWFQNRRRRMKKEGRSAEIRRAGEWESTKRFIEEELPVFQLPPQKENVPGKGKEESEGWEKKRGSLSKRRYTRNGENDVLALHTPPTTPPSTKLRTLKEINTDAFHFEPISWPSPSSSAASSPSSSISSSPNATPDMKELRKQFMLLSVAGPRVPWYEQQLIQDEEDNVVGAARVAITTVPVKAPLGRGRVGGGVGAEKISASTKEKKRLPKKSSASSRASSRSVSSSSTRSLSTSSSRSSFSMPPTPPDAVPLPLPASGSLEGYKSMVDVFGQPEYEEEEGDEEVFFQQHQNLFDVSHQQIDFQQSYQYSQNQNNLFDFTQQQQPPMDFEIPQMEFDFDLEKTLAELDMPLTDFGGMSFENPFDPASFDAFPLDLSFPPPGASFDNSFGMPPTSFDLVPSSLTFHNGIASPAAASFDNPFRSYA